MTPEKALTDLKRKAYKPLYWLEGEEEYFIDEIVNFAEESILTESEAGFNLTIFYGPDAAWPEVVNACRRYPVFAEKQVVIIKEAQGMRDIAKLESYFEQPSPATLLFIAYKNKKIDGRTKQARLIKEKGVHVTSKKLYDNELPEWVALQVKNKGLNIQPKALFLLIDHIGNDLSRLHNEIGKLSLNLDGKKTITEDEIEKYTGVSKEFNVFELTDALAAKDLYKAIRIAQYFEANPKAAPLPLVFSSLYNFFSKLQLIYAVPPGDNKAVAQSIGVSDWAVKNYLQAAQRYLPQSVEKALPLLHRYNLKSIGIDDAGTPDGMLLKEMIVRILQD